MENNKLWCCANSAIELVDTVKKKENKHTNITKKNKTITGDNSANGRGNIFTKKKWNKHKIEKTQIKKWLRNLTGSGRLKTKQKKKH